MCFNLKLLFCWCFVVEDRNKYSILQPNKTYCDHIMGKSLANPILIFEPVRLSKRNNRNIIYCHQSARTNFIYLPTIVFWEKLWNNMAAKHQQNNNQNSTIVSKNSTRGSHKWCNPFPYPYSWFNESHKPIKQGLNSKQIRILISNQNHGATIKTSHYNTHKKRTEHNIRELSPGSFFTILPKLLARDFNGLSDE